MVVVVLLRRWLGAMNGAVLSVGRAIAVAAIVCMVAAILTQVFYRYVLNNALPWPDEAARFFMLWMIGLVAPFAYRQGGFVAIDMLLVALPRRVAAALDLILLTLSLLVLVIAVQVGMKHVNSGWLFASSSLKLPLDLIGLTPFSLKLVWMYASLWVGFILMVSVNIELMLRALLLLAGHEDEKPAITSMQSGGAE